MSDLLCTVMFLFIVAVLGRVLFSWVPVAPESPVAVVRVWLVRLTEPVMGPLRRALPALRMGDVSLDLSPIVLIIGLQLLRSAIC